MLKRNLAVFLASLSLGVLATPAQAHFQLVHTAEVNLPDPATIPMQLVFWHPMENGHVMDMAKPREFYYVFRGERHDLLDSLKSIEFQGLENKGKGFVTEVKVQRNGDYVFVLTPEPYFEKNEDAYIQQITKSYVNRGGLPDAWHEPLGLVTEILPYNKPNNVLVGSTFTAQVLREGKPLQGVEIEIEYMSAEPNAEQFKPSSKASFEPKGGTLVAISDANGMFTFGIPKAGFWGFAALGSGPVEVFEGKPLSQDAVIWIRADEFENK